MMSTVNTSLIISQHYLLKGKNEANWNSKYWTTVYNFWCWINYRLSLMTYKLETIMTSNWFHYQLPDENWFFISVCPLNLQTNTYISPVRNKWQVGDNISLTNERSLDKKAHLKVHIQQRDCLAEYLTNHLETFGGHLYKCQEGWRLILSLFSALCPFYISYLINFYWMTW